MRFNGAKALRGVIAFAALALAASLGPGLARADQSFVLANLTPANGAHVSYADWLAAGRYVQFSIKPDNSYPCASEYYFLEINGSRVGRVNGNCITNVYIATTGNYSWRVTLYVFENATSATGPVSTFTVDQQAVAPPAPSAAVSDTKPPIVKAIHSYGRAGRTAELQFTVRDNSRAARAGIVVVSGTRVLKQITRPSVRADGSAVYLLWKVPKGMPHGSKAFCVVAVDAAGNSSKSCSTVTIS